MAIKIEFAGVQEDRARAVAALHAAFDSARFTELPNGSLAFEGTADELAVVQRLLPGWRQYRNPEEIQEIVDSIAGASFWPAMLLWVGALYFIDRSSQSSFGWKGLLFSAMAGGGTFIGLITYVLSTRARPRWNRVLGFEALRRRSNALLKSGDQNG
jgi:hypothetical protein